MKNQRFNTISSRFTLIVSVAVVGGMLVTQLVSCVILYQTVHDYSQATMTVANENICIELEDDYYSLLQISQMMRSSGMVGKEFLKYLQADTYLDRWETFATMEELLATVSFSAGGQLAIYYDTQTGENYLHGYQNIREGFALEQIPQLSGTGEVTWHAIHNSQSRLSGVPVVSLVRRTSFWENENMVVYVEKQTNIDVLLKEFQDSYKRNFVFLQVDSSGCVCYSSAEEIPVGTRMLPILEMEEDFGQWGDYFCSKRRDMFGGYSLLLVPRAELYENMYAQIQMLWLSVAISAGHIILAVVLLNELIVKKSKILQQEILRVGGGDFRNVTQYTGLYDYDQILDRFDWMTDQILLQMQAVEAAERRRGEIEREILRYQINPHFLLNSLNSAYWQAKMNIQGGVDQYIAQLTGILRYSLGKDADTPILKKEVDILRLYLQLQEKHYDFTYSLDVQEGDYLNLRTPRLFIQPVVENAIEHGVDIGDHISIHVFRKENWACVQVEDNGVGMGAEVLQKIEENMDRHNSRAGIGLRYVKTVITAMFGDAARMSIESWECKGTRVCLMLPLGDEFPEADLQRGECETDAECTDR